MSSGRKGPEGAEVKLQGAVATDGGEGNVDCKGMQAGRQDGKLSLKINRCSSQTLWQLLKNLQNRQLSVFHGNAIVLNNK
jgi:hypothetical protein